VLGAARYRERALEGGDDEPRGVRDVEVGAEFAGLNRRGVVAAVTTAGACLASAATSVALLKVS
jgi:hypothetical protein